jgi:transposase
MYKRKFGEEGVSHRRAGNRHLRRALYMPALVASRCDPHAKAFFESFLARKEARLQVLIAIARKLLHPIYGMFRSGLKYEGNNKVTLS